MKIDHSDDKKDLRQLRVEALKFALDVVKPLASSLVETSGRLGNPKDEGARRLAEAASPFRQDLTVLKVADLFHDYLINGLEFLPPLNEEVDNALV